MIALRWGIVLLLAVFGLAGCDAEVTPEDEVIAQYQRGQDAIAARDPVAFRNTMTNERWGRLVEAQRLALECSASETKKLAPNVLRMVLMFRNRIEPEKLASMSVDDLILTMMDAGVWEVYAEYGIVPHQVTINGETAELQLGSEVEERSSGRVRFGRRGLVRSAVSLAAAASTSTKTEPIPGLVYGFRNINGYWYADFTDEQGRKMDEAAKAAAAEAGVPVHDFLAAYEEEEFGSMKKDIWKPVGKKKK
ncbi:MAG TPA: hypothetical protein VD971_06175 [Phycisphaerales bacterium]|nr:hypothetical protein [Phycisphaerales bacterium]